MSVSIISCPGCKQLILSDTIQCPKCQHVLDEDKVELITTELPAVVKTSDDEVSCPDCGELVRTGLVRCWRCGGFLREEIAETYQKMLDSPQKTTYSSLAAEQLNESVSETDSDGESSTEPDGPEDNDFELADGVAIVSQQQLLRQQAEERAEAQQRKASATEPAASEETYGLAAKSATETESTSHSPAEDAEAPAGAEEQPAAKEDSDKPQAEESTADTSDSDQQGNDDQEAQEELATTGDALLDIAMKEEVEATSRRKARARTKSQGKGERVAMKGFLFVYCPNGHQIQVEEKHRGQTGRCPRCRSFFHVPQLDWKMKKELEKQAEQDSQKESRYSTWQVGAKLHQVDPTKLKLKPGSLQKEFQEVDLGYTSDSLLILTHGKQNAGLFAGEKNKKKIDELRADVQEYLRLEKELLDLPVAGYREYSNEDMEKVQIVQPAAYIHESIFAGVPVFGEGLIAVRMPVTDQDKDVKDVLFVSFSLSEFRTFAAQAKELFGIDNLGQPEEIPLEDTTSKHKCHYSDRVIESIGTTEFHHADPNIQLEITGRKCQACGLFVSEESRKKEKLGGAAGKGIAKAKCPNSKCAQKFGNTTLYGLKKEEGQPDDGLDSTGGLT